MTPEDVPDELVQAVADVLKQNGLWGAWEPEQTEEEARKILVAVLPLYEKQLLLANLRRHLNALPAVRPAPPPPPRITVLIAESHVQANRWCHENRRSVRDPHIIRIVHSADQYRLQGIGNFEVVDLSPCQNYDEVMAYIAYRQGRSRPA